MMTRYARHFAAHLVLLVLACAACGQPTSAAAGKGQSAELGALAATVGQVVRAHRQFYLGSKSPARAAAMPAVIWHWGEGMSPGGDLTAKFEPAYQLGFNRDAAKFRAMAAAAEALRPKAEALSKQAAAAAEAARRVAAVLTDPKPGALAGVDLPVAAEANAPSDLDVLLSLAVAALRAGPPAPARAAACLLEVAGRLDHLADLDRWQVLNCRWVCEDHDWAAQPGLAPRSLCYSIQLRYNDVAAIQSRVEDILLATPAEQAVWRCVVASGDEGGAATTMPADLLVTLPKARRTLAALCREEMVIDKQAAALAHARRLAQARTMRIKKYLPVVAKLEYLQRELALAEWGMQMRAATLVVDDQPARSLSLTARAALARLAESLSPAARRKLKPVLAEMLSRPYMASYADLCLYQAAVMSTEAGLAARISRWLDITTRPDTRGLMEIMHATPGAMTAGQRSDNSYQPQILAWAAECHGKDRLTRFRQAHGLAHQFARACGYNLDKPVHTMREVLEDRLVDCIAACRIHGSVAAAAGVEGIVPVRYWRRSSGHSVIGLRTADGVLIVDPLGGWSPRRFGQRIDGVVTVETGAPTFCAYVTDAMHIVASGKTLRRTLPYLVPPRR
ncbi:MAG TPA: hypothetical protein VNA25_16690 [Phycisphaerae bacterium]|nr:hypothetical protein [Phycisphaerae bacterium]